MPTVVLLPSTQQFGTVKPDPCSTHPQNLKYVLIILLAVEKVKPDDDFELSAKFRHFV